jgi:hypothetical protein
MKTRLSGTNQADRADPRVEKRLTRYDSDFSDVQLPPLPQVPRMICPSDQRYLYWLTSQAYSGQGAVVELGSFLGASAIQLGAGLRDAGFDAPLWCYDKFEWSGSARWSERFGIALPNKANYRSIFLRNVQPVYRHVRAIRTDIKRIKWKEGCVEILFLDAPKRLEDISPALTQFGPHLVPAFSLIVCQDYAHAPSFELAACLSQLAEKLELIHIVQGSCAVSFALREPLSRADTSDQALSFRGWSVAEARQRWAAILAPLPRFHRELLELGLALLLHNLGFTAEAIKLTQETPLSPAMVRHWRQWVPTLYSRYAPVFDALGVRPGEQRRNPQLRSK